MKTIILTGGGTAGHIIPNIALLPELKKHFDRIYYIGSTPMEEKLIKKEHIPYYSVTSVKLDRCNYASNLKIPYLLNKGIREAASILNKLSPNIVFSKGGYVSLPVCFAAIKKKIPVVCHESDYTLGLANKLVAKMGGTVFTSFPETKNGIYTGNPIRKEIFFPSLPLSVSIDLHLDPNKKILLICGGSLGSTAINSVVYKSLPTLLKEYNVIHISGKNGDFNIKYPNYYQFEYSEHFLFFLKICDIVICRSGSNTLFEIASVGKHCITIPLPKNSSRGDQILNAKSFEKQGLCKILYQTELSPESLIKKINEIKSSPIKKLDTEKINQNIVNKIVSFI